MAGSTSTADAAAQTDGRPVDTMARPTPVKVDTAVQSDHAGASRTVDAAVQVFLPRGKEQELLKQVEKLEMDLLNLRFLEGFIFCALAV